jgi:hypothetical protein
MCVFAVATVFYRSCSMPISPYYLKASESLRRLKLSSMHLDSSMQE